MVAAGTDASFARPARGEGRLGSLAGRKAAWAGRGVAACGHSLRLLMSRELGLRIASGVVLGAIVLGTLAIGGLAFALFWLVAGAAFAIEALSVSRIPALRPLSILAAAVIGATALAAHVGIGFWPAAVPAALGLLAALLIVRRARQTLAFTACLLAGLVVALVPPILREDPAIGLVGPALLFAVVWSTDIAAYFTGRALGGPKLMPRVSPKKTWSGAIGGLLAATLAGLGTVALARSRGGEGLAEAPLWLVALGSAVASIVSQAGDLLESALKRRYGVKDSGRTIPGHGGVMDRLDGFAAVCLLVALVLVLRLSITP